MPFRKVFLGLAFVALAFVVTEIRADQDFIANRLRQGFEDLQRLRARRSANGESVSQQSSTPWSLPKRHCGSEELLQKISEEFTRKPPRAEDAQEHYRQYQQRRAEKRAAGDINSLRFSVNTSWISSDPQACKTVGQVVQTSSGTHTCNGSDIITTDMLTDLENNLLPTMLDLMSSLISVESLGDTLYFPAAIYASQSTCGSASIPLPSSGVQGQTGFPNADFWLGVSAQWMDPEILANCAPCSYAYYQVGIGFGRPIAAGINLNPIYLATLDPSNEFQYYMYIRTLLHELTHGLGLGSDAFNPNQTFYDIDNSYRTTAATDRGVGVTLWTGPNVKRFAQNHFNCSTLQGFEIENNGGDGTAGGHWELRTAGEELMTGIGAFDLNKMTNLTLGFLKDLGFWLPDMSKAELLTWGKDQGCSFATEKCDSGGAWNNLGYFCTNNEATSCGYDRTFIGYCWVVNYTSNLPTPYQYFTYPKTGGPIDLLDYCPVTIAYSDGDCYFSANSTYRYNTGQVFGSSQSMCLDFENSGYIGSDSGCFLYQCDGSTLNIATGGGQYAECVPGNQVQFTTPTGITTVYCPDASENFCAKKTEIVITEAQPGEPDYVPTAPRSPTVTPLSPISPSSPNSPSSPSSPLSPSRRSSASTSLLSVSILVAVLVVSLVL